MFKIDLDYLLEDLSGKPMGTNDDFHVGKTLANLLSGIEKSPAGAIKLDDWAITLWNKKPLMIDSTDKDVLTAFVENAERATRRQKAMILRTIKAAVSSEEKKK